MNYNQIQKLSTDLSHLLENGNDHDVKISVGKEPDIKEFKAHSIILSTRSIYFKKVLSEQWANKVDGFFISEQPDISPTVFDVLLKYIYSGTFFVDDNDGISFVDILIASDALELPEIYQELEISLRENESAWKLLKDFITLFQFRVRFTDLYEVAIGLVCRNAKVIFNSKEFLEMKEELLIQLLIRDDLKLEEIEIWDYLIKWGIKNTDSIPNDDFTELTQTDLTELKKTLQNCISHIRFSQMSPKLFDIVRKKYKIILTDDIVDDTLQYFFDPNSKPLLKNLSLRLTANPLDSRIINAKDVAEIASWIDKKKGIPYHLKDIPIKFELIYRASREAFSTDRFHECCDNKGPTVVIIKVRNSGEIIGGYNPLDWRSIKLVDNESTSYYNLDPYIDHKCKTSNSFIFSLSSSRNGVIPVLSRVTSKKEAIIWCKDKGPCFGQDLCIPSDSRFGESKQKSYEKKIIDRETFKIEEYEVFRIIDNRFSFLEFAKKTCSFTGRMIKKTFQFVGGTILSIARYLINVDIEIYKKLFMGSAILALVSLAAFIVYKIIVIISTMLTEIAVVFLIAAIFVFLFRR